MGCDIHAHFEIKINGQWHHYSHPRLRRNYEVFAKIAGVRNRDMDTEPIAEPRGLPENMSIITKFEADRWAGDGHSHTWLSSEEFRELYGFMFELYERFGQKTYKLDHEELGYLCSNGWADWRIDKQGYQCEIQDFRFICWFDN